MKTCPLEIAKARNLFSRTAAQPPDTTSVGRHVYLTSRPNSRCASHAVQDTDGRSCKTPLPPPARPAAPHAGCSAIALPYSSSSARACGCARFTGHTTGSDRQKGLVMTEFPIDPTDLAVLGEHDGPHGHIGNEDAHLSPLRRIEGQGPGLQLLVEHDTTSTDILTQAAAMTRALQSFSLGPLDEHLRHCVVDAVAQGGGAADEKLAEASAAIGRLVRS